MIKNIIFDFGDIFINLDKPATAKEMEKFGFQGLTPELERLFHTYEKGLITSNEFLSNVGSTFPKATPQQLISAWNAILMDFPENRLEFIENFAKKNTYRLFLLSNTNDIHIECVKEQMGKENYDRFKNCFEQFYLSHEIFLRKPDAEIYQFVLEENNLIPSETFVGDLIYGCRTIVHYKSRSTCHYVIGDNGIKCLNLINGEQFKNDKDETGKKDT